MWGDTFPHKLSYMLMVLGGHPIVQTQTMVAWVIQYKNITPSCLNKCWQLEFIHFKNPPPEGSLSLGASVQLQYVYLTANHLFRSIVCPRPSEIALVATSHYPHHFHPPMIITFPSFPLLPRRFFALGWLASGENVLLSPWLSFFGADQYHCHQLIQSSCYVYTPHGIRKNR